MSSRLDSSIPRMNRYDNQAIIVSLRPTKISGTKLAGLRETTLAAIWETSLWD